MVEIFNQSARASAFVIVGVISWTGLFVIGMGFPFVVVRHCLSLVQKGWKGRRHCSLVLHGFTVYSGFKIHSSNPAIQEWLEILWPRVYGYPTDSHEENHSYAVVLSRPHQQNLWNNPPEQSKVYPLGGFLSVIHPLNSKWKPPIFLLLFLGQPWSLLLPRLFGSSHWNGDFHLFIPSRDKREVYHRNHRRIQQAAIEDETCVSYAGKGFPAL